MHFKRGKARNARAGCKLCKPWKVNGFRTGRLAGEKFGDDRRDRRRRGPPSCLRSRRPDHNPAVNPLPPRTRLAYALCMHWSAPLGLDMSGGGFFRGRAVDFLELDGAQVAERGMEPPLVVDLVDEAGSSAATSAKVS